MPNEILTVEDALKQRIAQLETELSNLKALTRGVRELQRVFFNGGTYAGQKYGQRDRTILALSKKAEKALDLYLQSGGGKA